MTRATGLSDMGGTFSYRMRGAIALLLVLTFATACSKPAPKTEKRSQLPLPGMHTVEDVFKLNGNSYVLSLRQAGVIDDAALAAGAEGARRFDFVNRIVHRHLRVEKQEPFEALGPAEQREMTDIAKGALIFIRILEKEPAPIPESYQRDKQILNVFLAAPPKETRRRSKR